MTLEHMINQDERIGAVIAITDTLGDTYEYRAGMPKDQLLIYSGKMVELCESVQGVREDILTPIRNAAAEVGDAIKTANAEALGPAFSELMMRSVACMLVDSYRGVKAEKAAQGSRAGEMIRQLGKDYHTAASGYDEKSRASFDNYIGETASGLGLDKTIVAKVLLQAESIYKKHEKKEKRPRGFTGIRSIKDVARGKRTLGQSGAAYAGREEPDGIVDSELESIAEQPGEPRSEADTLVMSKEAIHEGFAEIEAGLEPEGDAENPKPLDQLVQGQQPMKPVEPPARVYTRRSRAKTSITRKLSKGEPDSERPSAVLKRPPEERYKGRARKSARVTGVRYKSGLAGIVVRGGAKIAGAVTVTALVLYVAALLTHIYSPKSRQYLGPEKLGVVGRIIEGPSKWARGEK